MADESNSSSSHGSSSTNSASSGCKGETTTEAESDFPDLEQHHSAYGMDSMAATALTASIVPDVSGPNLPDATTQAPEGPDIEATHIQTLADLQQRLKEVPPEQLVILYFQSAASMSCRLVGPALAGLRDAMHLEVIKLDLQDHEEISTAYSINQTPTFVFIKNSEKLEQFSGADVKKLKSVINPLTSKLGKA